MKNTISNTLLITITSLMTNVACASDFQQCPLELLVNQTAQSTMSDWKIFNSDEKHPYVGISFSEGSPDKKMILAPDKEKKVKGGVLATWHFPTSAEEYWASCLYAETSVTIARRLPSNIQSCAVEYDGRSSPPIIKNWHCTLQKK
ncbi:MAG: hypothetical protein H7335_16595 [Massilia sp.]|nr:hypothetical protein [Massilia sp.]